MKKAKPSSTSLHVQSGKTERSSSAHENGSARLSATSARASPAASASAARAALAQSDASSTGQPAAVNRAGRDVLHHPHTGSTPRRPRP